MKKAILIAGAAAIAVALPAIAAQMTEGSHSGMMMKADMTRAQVEAMVKERFIQADANKDGAVTMEEITAMRAARRAQRMDERFKTMDANNDGSISRAEFDAAHAAMGEMGRGGGGPEMGMSRSGMGGMGPGMDHAHPDGGPGMRMGGPGDGMGHSGMGMKFNARMFERADANKDGKVTLAEANKAALAHFAEVDADKNGTVTAQERMNFWQSKRADWMKAGS